MVLLCCKCWCGDGVAAAAAAAAVVVVSSVFAVSVDFGLCFYSLLGACDELFHFLFTRKEKQVASETDTIEDQQLKQFLDRTRPQHNHANTHLLPATANASAPTASASGVIYRTEVWAERSSPTCVSDLHVSAEIAQ